jgi:hypothetical protein
VRHGNYDVQTIQTDHLRVPRRVTGRLVDNKVEAEGHRNYCVLYLSPFVRRFPAFCEKQFDCWDRGSPDFHNSLKL